MRTISSIFSLTSGYWTKSRARLVSGPMGTRVTFSSLRSNTRRMASTAWSFTGCTVTSSKAKPSIPDSPWVSPASYCMPVSDREAPAATGTPAFHRVIRRRALWVVFSTLTLPDTVVISWTSSSGLNMAMAMAAASSMPGSVSIMILRMDLSSSLLAELPHLIPTISNPARLPQGISAPKMGISLRCLRIHSEQNDVFGGGYFRHERDPGRPCPDAGAIYC